MSKNRKYVLVGSSLLALVAAGGATALAADGGPSGTPTTTRSSQGMGHGAGGASMMRQLDTAAMGRMMRGMPMKLDEAQLKRMTEAHNAMVGGMMDENMMSGSDVEKGR